MDSQIHGESNAWSAAQGLNIAKDLTLMLRVNERIDIFSVAISVSW